MAEIITYRLISGALPITVSISPAVAPDNVHYAYGDYTFSNIPSGDYVLTFTDALNCTVEMIVCNLPVPTPGIVYNCVFDFTIDVLAPSPTPTNEIVTPTPTVTPSITRTPTVTPTITRTPTVTFNPSPSASCARPTGLSEFNFYHAYSGVTGTTTFIHTLPDACEALPHYRYTGFYRQIDEAASLVIGEAVYDNYPYTSCILKPTGYYIIVIDTVPTIIHIVDGYITDYPVCPSPSQSVTPTPTRMATPSATPSITPSITTSITPSPSGSPLSTPSRTPSRSVSGTPGATLTPTPSRTPSQSISMSVSTTPGATLSRTPSHTPSITPSYSPSPSITPSITPSNLTGFGYYIRIFTCVGTNCTTPVGYDTIQTTFPLTIGKYYTMTYNSIVYSILVQATAALGGRLADIADEPYDSCSEACNQPLLKITNLVASCNLNTITVTIEGGTAPYQYSIDNGVTLSSPTNNTTYTWNSLTGGVYDVYVKDNANQVYLWPEINCNDLHVTFIPVYLTSTASGFIWDHEGGSHTTSFTRSGQSGTSYGPVSETVSVGTTFLGWSYEIGDRTNVENGLIDMISNASTLTYAFQGTTELDPVRGTIIYGYFTNSLIVSIDMCFVVNATPSTISFDDKLYGCTTCGENLGSTVTVYFNKTQLETLGIEGSTWYNTSALTTTVANGYYFDGSDQFSAIYGVSLGVAINLGTCGTDNSDLCP